MRLLAVWTSAVLALTVSAARANEDGHHLLYAGGGASTRTQPGGGAEKPFVLGYARLKAANQTFLGLDVSGEGVMLHNNVPEQAFSVNLIVGRNLFSWDDFRIDLSVLGGVRTKSSKCPSSYIGNSCYANAEPSYEYGFNYGAAIFWSHKKFMLGLRATGVSTQALLGLKF